MIEGKLFLRLKLALLIEKIQIYSLEIDRGLFMKNTLENLIELAINSENLNRIILSNSLDKNFIEKTTIRPLMIKKKKMLQISEQKKNQIFHTNFSLEKSRTYIEEHLKTTFREGHFFIGDEDYHVWLRKDGTYSINATETKSKPDKNHNRKKNYLLEEGTPYPFFVALKVMDAEGKVFAEKRDKFRQVNHFLEIASTAISDLDHSRRIKIIDLGCGKAYLTFALYHYLHVELGLDVEITGVDLKQEVISLLNKISLDCGYERLKFQCGSIKDFPLDQPIDMMIALHACDIATDSALAKAVSLKAKVILAAPCCQHELFTQIESPLLSPLLKHGILKERFSALATDACRALILNLLGYKTQILEFVDPQHTPKNILIKAIKTQSIQNEKHLLAEYELFKNTLHISPALEKLLLRKFFDSNQDLSP